MKRLLLSCPGMLMIFKKANKKSLYLSIQGFFMRLVISLVLILACSLALLTTLNAGALVVLLLSQVCQNAGLCTTALKSFKSIVQRLVFLDIDFRHLFHSLHLRLSTLSRAKFLA